MERETQLKIWIEQKQTRVESGFITNGKTLKYAKGESWKN